MRPYTLIAELTHRCPLRCPYCSNPLELAAQDSELTTDEWRSVLGEAEGLGVMQVHFTGGEPLVRRDLEALVERARSLELYAHLVTSGIPLDRERLRALRDAGLDAVQLSFQGAEAAGADVVAGVASHARKLEVAEWIKALDLPLTVNFVLHRHNIDTIDALIALGERLGADRIELANAQYQGWALTNRGALLPSEAQISSARAAAQAARARLEGRTEVVFVLPDYYADRPRACMEGWGRRYVLVDPSGVVLPCHAARMLPGLRFETVRDRSLETIWLESESINRFRGTAFLPEPCASCPERERDFGGCRCQAFLLTGDATETDPACALAPAHGLVEAARLRARAPSSDERPVYLYRSAAAAPRGSSR